MCGHGDNNIVATDAKSAIDKISTDFLSMAYRHTVVKPRVGGVYRGKPGALPRTRPSRRISISVGGSAVAMRMDRPKFAARLFGVAEELRERIGAGG